MSENTLIALITLVGTILGALIGAFATLKAAEVRAKNVDEPGKSSNISCAVVGLSTSVAAILGLIFGRSFCYTNCTKT